jgi:hypothetical protein
MILLSGLNWQIEKIAIYFSILQELNYDYDY